MASPISTNSPARQLSGRELRGGWIVGELLERPAYSTGSCFSQGYVVKAADGRRGYLKVLDYSAALVQADPATVLNAMTEAFLFERQICDVCVKKAMSRIVRAIDSGTLFLDPQSPTSVVQYLVFELAEGDVRKHLDTITAFDEAGALRALHHACTGLFQLHTSGIAHQDLKPSNMLKFQDSEWKVGDLGRASSLQHKAPHDPLPVAGDPVYAPPESLYHRQVDPDWSKRRFSCDAYLMGRMILFMFTHTSMTAQLMDHLDPSQHWSVWTGTYDEVLPYLRDSFGKSIKSNEPFLPPRFRPDLVEMVRQLCDPDPQLRGSPELRGRIGNQYSLERFISRLDLLASKAEVSLRRSL